jgi:hypothetical protein
MKIQYFLLSVFLSFYALSCTSTKKKVEDKIEIETKENNAVSISADSFYIVKAEKAIILLNPTKEIYLKGREEMQQEYGEEGLDEISSDNAFYINEAFDYAKSKKLQIYNTDQKIVHFYKKDASVYILENKINGISSEMYFFDGVKDPKRIMQIPMISDNNEFKAYFD